MAELSYSIYTTAIWKQLFIVTFTVAERLQVSLLTLQDKLDPVTTYIIAAINICLCAFPVLNWCDKINLSYDATEKLESPLPWKLLKTYKDYVLALDYLERPPYNSLCLSYRELIHTFWFENSTLLWYKREKIDLLLNNTKTNNKTIL